MQEFSIKSKVDLSTKEAEKKIKNIQDKFNNKPLEIELKIKNSNGMTAMFKQLEDLQKKANSSLNNELLADYKARLKEETKLKQAEVKQRHKLELNEQKNLHKQEQMQLKAQLEQNTKLKQTALKEDSKIKIAELKANAGKEEGLIEEQHKKELALYKDKISTISKLEAQLTKGVDAISYQNIVSEMSRLNDEAETLRLTLGDLEVFDAKQLNKSIVNTSRAMTTLRGDIESTVTAFNGMDFKTIDASIINDVRTQLEKLQDKAKQDIALGIDTGDVMNRLKDVQKLIKDLENTEKINLRVDTEGLRQSTKFLDDFKSSFAAFTLGDIAGDLVVDGIRETARAFLDLDKAIVNVKKVADATDLDSALELDSLQEKAIGVAKNVGMSVSDVMNATASSIQAGLGNVEESVRIAEQVMKLANVGELAQDAASNSVNTMVNGFNINPLKEFNVQVDGTVVKTDELTVAMDALNHLSNNYATDTANLTEAMRNGGTVLGQYGLSFEESAALMMSGIEVLQNGSQVGNGLKSIAMNMTGIKTSAADGEIQLNKTAKTLRTVAGIDVFTDSSQTSVKDMTEILGELDDKWADMSESDRAGLAEAIAGKEQAKVFQALMSNFDAFESAMIEFENGDHFGSMEAENAQYVDSIAGKFNELKVNLLEIFSTIISSDFTKDLLDIAIAVTDTVAAVIKQFDSWNLSAIPLIGTFGAMKTIMGALALGKSSPIGAMQSGMEAAGLAMGTLNTSASNTGGFISRLGTSFKNMFLSNPEKGFRGVADAMKNGAGEASTLGGKIKGIGKGLGGSLTLLPKVGLAITAAFGAYKLIEHAATANERYVQSLRDSIELRDNEITNLEGTRTGLQNLQAEYDALAGKANLSVEEQTRLNELTNELAQLMPDLVLGYDENGNAIINMTGDVTDLIHELDLAIDAKERLNRVETKKIVEETKGDVPQDLFKIADAQEKHNATLERLYGDRQLLEEELYRKTGKDREKTFEKIDRINKDITKANDKFNEDYAKSISDLAKYSKDVSDVIFGDVFADSTFANSSDEVKTQFEKIKGYMDFSDMTTDEQFQQAELALRGLIGAANDGTIDLEGLNTSLGKINSEYAKTGDMEAYSRSMQGLADEYSKLTGIDADVLMDMFEGLPRGLENAEDGLTKFLDSYNKTKSDLFNKDDDLAGAIKKQFDSITQAIDTYAPTGDVEIDLETIAVFKNDQNIPEELRQLCSEMLADGYSSTEVLEFAQSVLIDMSDGEIDIEGLQQKIDAKFGEGKYTVTSDMKIMPIVEEGAYKEKIESIKEKYKELPEKAVTVIETIGTAEKAQMFIEEYSRLPKSVKTQVLTIGDPQQALLFAEMYNDYPDEVSTLVKANGVDGAISILGEAKKQMDEIPEDIDTELIVNENGTISIVSKVKEGINELPTDSKINITVDANGVVTKVDEVGSAVDKVDGKDATVTAKAETQQAIDGIGTLDTRTQQFRQSSTVNPFTIRFASEIGQAKQGIDTLDSTHSAYKQKASEVTISNYQANTGPAKTNIIGLGDVHSQYRNLVSTVTNSNYQANTSPAKANIERLQTAHERYKQLCSQVMTSNFRANTGGASSNIGSLYSQLSNYRNSFSGRTFTTTLKTVKTIITNRRSYNLGGSKEMSDVGIPVAPLPGDSTTSTTQPTPSMRTVGQVGVGNAVGGKPMARVTPTVKTTTNITDGNIANASGTIERAKRAADNIGDSHVTNVEYNINGLLEYENAIKQLGHQVSLLDKEIENAYGEDKIKLLEKKIALTNEQKEKEEEYQKLLEEQQWKYKDELEKSGFEFDGDNFTNYEEHLLSMEKNVDKLESAYKTAQDKASSYKGDDEKYKAQLEEAARQAGWAYDAAQENLDKTKDYLDAYMDVTFDKIPQSEEAQADFNNTIKDAMDEQTDIRQEALDEQKAAEEEAAREKEEALKKQQEEEQKLREEAEKKKQEAIDKANDDLKKTQEIEEKITAMYKEQIEERIEEMEKETEAKLDALNEQKEAYNDYRDEMDYQDDYEEQLNSISDLERQIEIAKKDDSLGGQKKLQDLLDQLAEEQENLQDLVQDKIDENVNDMFDDEQDRLEQESDEEIENFENEWTDDKIADKVEDALNSGMFTDIDGEIYKLEDALLGFAERSGDLFGVMGAVVKDELLSNLETAFSTAENLSNVLATLGIGEMTTVPSITTTVIPSMPLNFNEPLIHVEGSITEDVMPEVEAKIQEAKDDLIEKITSYMR